MGYCKNCHVLLGDTVPRCPLCGELTSKGSLREEDLPEGEAYPDSDFRPGSHELVDKSMPNDLSGGEQRLVIVELLSVAAGIALAVSILADLFTSGHLSWSLYSSVGICALWLFSAIPLMVRRSLWIIFTVLAPSVLIMVLLLDVFDGNITWYLGYGLPIVLLLTGCTAACGGIIGSFRRYGLNVVAAILSFTAFFCVGLESIIDLNHHQVLSLDWSVVSSFALVPTAAILFYLHYRIVHQASLRKLFRL